MSPHKHLPQRKSPHAAPAVPEALDALDGVLIVDKPSGPTSHDIVARIRKKFKVKKVGHGGTLDPQATGVLIILLGRGTKLSSLFMASDKAYDGVIRLGIETDSQDAQGKVVREADCSGVTREALEGEMKALTGDIMQTPPMVSATKVDGVPLYKRARRGETVERKQKLIHVYEFKLTEFNSPRGTFSIRCTKGTYVRTLCADIGEALGCGAHLEALRRTQSGDMTIQDAVPMDKVMDMTRESLSEVVIPMKAFAGRVAPGKTRKG